MFLEELQTAFAEEWENITGASLTAKVSREVWIELWDKSTIIPNRFISSTTVWNKQKWDSVCSEHLGEKLTRPNWVKPLCSALFPGTSALEQSALKIKGEDSLAFPWFFVLAFFFRKHYLIRDDTYQGVLQLWVRVSDLAPRRWNMRRTAKLVPMECPDSTVMRLAILPEAWADTNSATKQ